MLTVYVLCSEFYLCISFLSNQVVILLMEAMNEYHTLGLFLYACGITTRKLNEMQVVY